MAATFSTRLTPTRSAVSTLVSFSIILWTIPVDFTVPGTDTTAVPAIMTHGGCVVLQESFEAGEALALIERERCSVYYGMSNMAWALLELPGWDSNERIGSYLEGRRCSGWVYLATGWPKTTHEGGYASDQTLMPCRPHRWQWDICAYQPTPSSSKPSCAVSSRQSGQKRRNRSGQSRR